VYQASYDAAGDMTCRAPGSGVTCGGSSPNGQTMTYDAERQLAHWQNTPSSPATQDDYLYDGGGQRAMQYVNVSGTITTTAYLLGGLEESTGGVITKYLGVAGLPQAVRVGSTLSYLTTDGLGSVSESFDTAGNETATQLFAPYGTVRYAANSMPTTKGFPGQHADVTTGLDYYVARYYDPQAGQFASADSKADGLSPYAYVAVNPETATDPSGHLYTTGPSGGRNSYRNPELIAVSGWNLDSSADNCYPNGCFTPGYHSEWYWTQHREELQDGDVIASYFGVHVGYESQTVIGLDGREHTPDYNVNVQETYFAPEVDPVTLTGPTYNMDLYTPTGTNWTGKNPDQPGGIVGRIIQKGNEGASIVVVDLRNVDPNGQLTQSELASYAALAVYSPYQTKYPSHVARVIFVNNGQVVEDFNPLNYGPPPADKSYIRPLEA